MRITDKDRANMKAVYLDCESEQEREDIVYELAISYDTTAMEIRQVLQTERAYKVKEGKTEKQQYSAALAAVTGISTKEWMKLTLKSQVALMDIFRGSNNDSI